MKLNMSVMLISTDGAQQGVYCFQYTHVEYIHDQVVKKLYCIVTCVQFPAVSPITFISARLSLVSCLIFMISAHLFLFNFQIPFLWKIIKWAFQHMLWPGKRLEIAT
jgi:hypothetical protein